MTQRFKRLSHSIYECKYHMVFCLGRHLGTSSILVVVSAYEEAIMQFRQGLAILNSLPDTPERAERELALQTSLAKAMQAGKR